MKVFPHKIKAGALQFATLISVVIAVLLAAFILLTYTQLQFTRQLGLSEKLIQQSHDGMAYVKQKDIPYNQHIEVALEGNFLGTLTLEQTHWGIFDKVISRASLREKEHQNIAWIGGQLSEQQRPSIYLADNNTPLVVVGGTKINGKAILPKQGVKNGNIAGRYYQGKKMIYGTRGVSKANLPEIPAVKRLYFQELLKKGIDISDSLQINNVSNGPIGRSFELPAQWFYRSGVIDLDHVDLTDNLIVKSDTLIRVSAFAKAKNILLVAPVIEIAAKFNGSMQAIASQKIKVGIRAQLNYPSALVLIKEEKMKPSNSGAWSGIRVERRAQIEGSILFLDATERTNQETAVQLQKESVLKGELYCEQTTEIKGTVLGSVFTHQFAVMEKGSVYANHLLDATIDSRKFPPAYGGMVTQDTEKTIVQWVE
jgi:hypothetical protein